MTDRKTELLRAENWQISLVKRWLDAGGDNSTISWTSIAVELEKLYPMLFVATSNPARKLRDFIKRRRALADIIVEEIQKNPEEQFYKVKKVLEQEAVKNDKDRATMAHVNDEDSDLESEFEHAPVDIIVEEGKADGSRKVEAEVVIPEDSEKLRDEDYLLKLLGYDPLIWEVISSSCRKGKWDAQIKGGEIKELHSFRVNANVRKRTDSISMQELGNRLIARLEEKDNRPTYKMVKVEGENIAILSIADLHLGKLSWAPECGGNYDYKICRDRFFYIINKAITFIKTIEKLDKVIFFWSQDFFHYDKLEITTTAGTRQDTDVRWQKLYGVGCDMLCDAFEILSTELKVPIVSFYTRSNHDTQVSYYALQYIYAWFRNDDNIIIDRSPIGRKYIQFGETLMGFAHGDEEKKRIHNIMQIEQKEAWGATSYHEFFLGHYHKQMLTDDNCGVVCRYLASPTETDAWHYNEGFIGAQKQAQVFIRNKYEGPTHEFTINVRD